jgi:2,3-bisphosphoglycerate-independent phosphoglycerate mutase
VEDGSLNKEPILQEAFAYAKKEGKKVHFMGLLSDGGVHSHISHLKGLLSAAAEAELKDVFVHAFTDGRDTDPQGGLAYVADLEAHLAKTTGSIASIVGRYFAMDRDKRWERVKKAYDLMVKGVGSESASAKEVLSASYAAGISDEFVRPALINKAGTINEGDVVLCFNFRTDRGRQITSALSQEAFPEYDMSPLNLHYVTMTRYADSFKGVKVIYEKDNLSETLGEVLEAAGKTQVRIAETEKYPHVTFFFSGGRENEFKGERRLMVSSPKVATYDLQPEMSAFEVRDIIIEDINTNSPDFICLNFANPDMVGHTGDMEAAVIACETVDACAKAVVKAGLGKDYTFIILADHGNADCMRNEDGSPNTAHTTQPVPCFLVGNTLGNRQLHEGVLGDVAPTLLDLLDVKKPASMTGKSLLI